MSKSGYVKLFGLWATFLVLHFAYDWLPVFPLKLLSAVDESPFQHFKVGFFAYLLVSLVEYLLLRRRAPVPAAWPYSRLWGALLTPWLIFILWYMAPAYYGPFPAVWMDILYANLMVALVAGCLVIVERQMETVTYSPAFKVLTVGLFLILLSLFEIFTFRLPWTDVFTEPIGS